ncbi:MAG: hypothetical protein H6Q10_2032 [Acidobacteria bacterium]|nr:hypothetical protein [Acidobacteriota bacterium]
MMDAWAFVGELIFWTAVLGVVIVVGVVWLAWKFIAAVIRSRRDS